MRAKIDVITLAVRDLARSLTFYRDGLGLETDGIVGTEFEDGAVVFFKMNDHLTLALYPEASLSKDAGVPRGKHNVSQFSIGHLVGSKEEVDEIVERAKAAGAVLPEPPRDRFWGGYSGYFQDLDGHLWEIAWNPDWRS